MQNNTNTTINISNNKAILSLHNNNIIIEILNDNHWNEISRTKPQQNMNAMITCSAGTWYDMLDWFNNVIHHCSILVMSYIKYEFETDSCIKIITVSN